MSVASLCRRTASEKNGIREENCALLGCYVAGSGNFLQMFRDNLSVPSSGFKNPEFP